MWPSWRCQGPDELSTKLQQLLMSGPEQADDQLQQTATNITELAEINFRGHKKYPNSPRKEVGLHDLNMLPHAVL